jgi:hypothetical protein
VERAVKWRYGDQAVPTVEEEGNQAAKMDGEAFPVPVYAITRVNG